MVHFGEQFFEFLILCDFEHLDLKLLYEAFMKEMAGTAPPVFFFP
jgi:hypothetical protein